MAFTTDAAYHLLATAHAQDRLPPPYPPTPPPRRGKATPAPAPPPPPPSPQPAASRPSTLSPASAPPPPPSARTPPPPPPPQPAPRHPPRAHARHEKPALPQIFGLVRDFQNLLAQAKDAIHDDTDTAFKA